MPSGRKKRHAAKKKKGNEPNSTTQNSSSSTHHSSENDDPRNQEEKDSDGGENEVVSPPSQGNQGPFTEGNEETEKREEALTVQSAVSESNSTEGDTVDSEVIQIVEVEKNGVVEIVKDVKLEDASESNSVDIECVEAVDTLQNGNAKKPEGAGLNDDPRLDEKKLEVEPDIVVLEAAYSGTVATKVDSLPKESTEITDVIPAVESSFRMDTVESVVPAVSEKVIHVAQTTTAENAVHSGLDLKEIEEKVLPPRDYSSEVPETVMDISIKAEETVLPVPVEVAAKLSSDVANDEVSVPVEDGKSLPISEGSTARAFDPVENTKKPESPENQPLVAPPPRRVEKTSWLGCCGIFDVITGSR